MSVSLVKILKVYYAMFTTGNLRKTTFSNLIPICIGRESHIRVLTNTFDGHEFSALYKMLSKKRKKEICTWEKPCMFFHFHIEVEAGVFNYGRFFSLALKVATAACQAID